MLTQKQERFVQELIKGRSQREAYKAAYDAERMTDKTVDEKACRLFADGKVRARYEELRSLSEQQAVDDAVSMRAFIIQQLKEIAAGEAKNERVEQGPDGEIRRRSSEAKQADRIAAMNMLKELYGITQQTDEGSVIRMDGAEDYSG